MIYSRLIIQCVYFTIMNSLNYNFTETNQFVLKHLYKCVKAIIDIFLMILFISNFIVLIGLILYLEIASILMVMEQFDIIQSYPKVLFAPHTFIGILSISCCLVLFSIIRIRATQQSLITWLNSKRIDQFFNASAGNKKNKEIIKDDLYWANYYFQRAEKFRYGDGVEENMEYAIKLYQAAAKLDNRQAQVSLSYLLLLNNHKNKQNLEKKAEAFMWAQKAAKKNEPGAWFNLGYMYKNGLGTSINKAKALFAFEQAIFHGFYNIEKSGAAFYEIGLLYLEDKDIAQNCNKAIKWLNKAVDADYPNSDKILQKAYREKNKQQKEQNNSNEEQCESHSKKQQASSQIINCPSCEKSLVIPNPIPKGNGICTKCFGKFRLKTDSHGNIQIYSIVEKTKNYIQLPQTDHEAREVLSILTHDGATLIRQAYKNKMGDYHPDKVNNLGVKLKKLAEHESKRINAAYDLLKNSA